jgi:hypothetical protein
MPPSPIPATFSTDLDIVFPGGGAAPGVNPFSSRALRGTLSPIDMAQGSDKLARTVNGTLVDISAPQMRKYKLEISGDDVSPPALDGLWVGMQVTVNCHVELAYLTAGGLPGRTPVSGSQHIDGNYTYYRPQFQMLIVSNQIDRQEWAAVVAWSLVLEEI